MLKLFVLAFLLVAQTAQAADLFSFPFVRLSREDFRRVSREVGNANSFPVVDAAAPYGLPGFDVGLGVSIANITEDEWPDSIDAPASWNQAFVRVVKGLPANIDVGAMYGKRLDGDESVLGGEVKIAVVEGSATVPAFGFRAAYTQLLESEMMDLQTLSAQAEISKGFVLITPYGGVGGTDIMANPKSGVTYSDKNENVIVPHVFAGAKITPLPFLSITLHGQYSFSEAPLLGALQLSAGL